MNLLVYNISLLCGLLLVAVGIGLWSLPAGVAAAGALLIALTLFNAYVIAPRMKR